MVYSENQIHELTSADIIDAGYRGGNKELKTLQQLPRANKGRFCQVRGAGGVCNAEVSRA